MLTHPCRHPRRSSHLSDKSGLNTFYADRRQSPKTLPPLWFSSSSGQVSAAVLEVHRAIPRADPRRSDPGAVVPAPRYPSQPGPLEDAARVESLYCCVPFRERSGAARMQVETSATLGIGRRRAASPTAGDRVSTNSTASANPRRRCKNICRTAASSHSNRVLGAWQRRPKSSSGRTGASTFLQLRSVAPNRLISYYTNTYD